jgi:hypothetical protein
MAEATAEGFEEVLEAHSKELAMEAANRWFSASNEALLQAGDQLDYDVFPIAQAAITPQWTPRTQAAEMAWPHEASRYLEHGTTEHETKASSGMLAFQWPKMRGEEFADTGKTFEEVFDTFPTVFFPEVTVSGLPRIGYVEHGRRKAARWLQSQSR